MLHTQPVLLGDYYTPSNAARRAPGVCIFYVHFRTIHQSALGSFEGSRFHCPEFWRLSIFADSSNFSILNSWSMSVSLCPHRWIFIRWIRCPLWPDRRLRTQITMPFEHLSSLNRESMLDLKQRICPMTDSSRPLPSTVKNISKSENWPSS